MSTRRCTGRKSTRSRKPTQSQSMHLERLSTAIVWALERGIEQGGAKIIHNKAYPIDGFPRGPRPCRLTMPCLRVRRSSRYVFGARGTYLCPSANRNRRHRAQGGMTRAGERSLVPSRDTSAERDSSTSSPSTTKGAAPSWPEVRFLGDRADELGDRPASRSARLTTSFGECM